jgi:hypothetical protein
VTPVLTSVIAVVGTLLGSVITYHVQRRTLERTLAEARYERARKEFLEASSALASAAMTLRRASYDRWKERRSSTDGKESDEARHEVFRLRVEARTAYYHLRLLADPVEDDELVKHAAKTVEEAGHVADAESFPEVRKRDQEARRDIERLVDLAGARLRYHL